MPPSKPDSVVIVPKVVAVREDEGRPPEIIPQQFQLRVRHSQQGLVLFCLVVSFADGASTTKTTIYLRITADSLDSLDRTDHNKTNANTKSPPYLKDVYKQLEDMQSVARLQFRLRSGKGVQLAVPLDFNIEKISDDTARSTFESAESLAAASFFSLYFQHNILRKTSLPEWKAAVLPFESVTEAMRKSYKDMLDVKRLYNGAGGRVHVPHGHHHHDGSSPPTTERCSSPAPATTASCGSTLPFETSPALQQGSPPPYDECLSEGQSPRFKPGAQSPGGDLTPPGYGDIERRHNVLDLSQGAIPRGKQNIDKHPTHKRKRSFAGVCSPGTARGASRPVKIPPSPFLDLDDENNAAHFLHLLQLQHQQIEQQRQQIQLQREQIELQREHIEDLQKNVGELQRRHGELEADCLKLETRQDQADDAIDNLSIDVGELEDKYAEVLHQIPDVCDEFKDLKENMADTLKEDICKLIEDSMEDSVAKKIAECVEAQADEVKRRIRQALQ